MVMINQAPEKDLKNVGATIYCARLL